MSQARHIESYVFKAGIGVLVELSASSESLIRRGDFVDLARGVAMHVAAMNPTSVDDLLHQLCVMDPAVTVNELMRRVAGADEVIDIVRFVRWVAGESPEPDTPRSPAVIYDLRSRAGNSAA